MSFFSGPTNGAGGAQEPTRDATAKVLAATINHLNIAAQREIGDFSARGDYNGAHYREAHWKEEIEEVIARHMEEHGRDAALRSILASIIEDLPTRRDWLDPALEREAREILGLNPLDRAPVLHVPLGEINQAAWERLKNVARGYADNCPKCEEIRLDYGVHRCPDRNPDPTVHATTFPTVPPVETSRMTREQIDAMNRPGDAGHRWSRKCSACGATDESATFVLSAPGGILCDGCMPF